MGRKWKEVCATAKRVARHADVARRQMLLAVRHGMQVKISFNFHQNVDVDIVLLQRRSRLRGR